MKALQITGYGDIKNNLAFNDIEKPTVKDNQVLIEVYAASVNPIDYKIVEGGLKQLEKLSFPASIGFDVSGMFWEELNSINGAGNSSLLLNYSTNDKKPYSGVSYYRLKQTDFDGLFSYSQIRSIKINGIDNFQIFPNPTKNNISLVGNNLQLEQINIYNTLGQDVTILTKQAKISKSKIMIDLSNLNEGIYYIKTKTTASKVHKQ